MNWAEHFTQLRGKPRPPRCPIWPAALPDKPAVNKSGTAAPRSLWVLFVCQAPRDGDALLTRMLAAMKLPPGRTAIALLREEDNWAEVAEKIAANPPRVVVALGALATNRLLGRRERLSSVHGRFFDCTVGELALKVVPVFHPDILRINPNMKRTTWLDLQRVMAFLQDSP